MMLQGQRRQCRQMLLPLLLLLRLRPHLWITHRKLLGPNLQQRVEQLSGHHGQLWRRLRRSSCSVSVGRVLFVCLFSYTRVEG